MDESSDNKIVTPDASPELKSLEKRIREAKHQQEEKDKPSDPPDGLSASRILSEMFAGVLVGAFFGYYLDRWIDSKPLFFITFVFLGIAAATRNIYKLSSK